MMKYYYYFLCVWLGLACTKKTQEDQLSADKYTYLAQLDLLDEPYEIKKKLDSLDISKEDIYHYCQKTTALTRKAKLIEAIYSQAPNITLNQNINYWTSIMYPIEDFCDYIARFKTPEHTTFMDIGSANGEKSFAALCLGFEQSIGVEYTEKLVAISKAQLASFIQKKQFKVYLGDAFDMSDTVYHQADFVYLYSPIKNNRLMAKLFYKLMQLMQEGNILMEVRMVYTEELRKLSAYQIPDLSNLVIKKQNNRFWYARYDENTIKWNPLEPL